jgi:hypothetical protein
MHLFVLKSESDFAADSADTSVGIAWEFAIINDGA